jgi:hypothetical protein
MEFERAVSLAHHINDRSQRFRAKVLDFSDQGLVIVSETLEDGTNRIHSETIADPHEHLRRVQEGNLKVDDEYRGLLEEWPG